MSDVELGKIEPKEIWVDMYEAAEITGYNPVSIRNIAQRMGRQSEAEREIKVRKRTGRWELWLPDLITWVKSPGHGPQPKRKKTD